MAGTHLLWTRASPLGAPGAPQWGRGNGLSPSRFDRCTGQENNQRLPPSVPRSDPFHPRAWPPGVTPNLGRIGRSQPRPREVIRQVVPPTRRAHLNHVSGQVGLSGSRRANFPRVSRCTGRGPEGGDRTRRSRGPPRVLTNRACLRRRGSALHGIPPKHRLGIHRTSRPTFPRLQPSSWSGGPSGSQNRPGDERAGALRGPVPPRQFADSPQQTLGQQNGAAGGPGGKDQPAARLTTSRARRVAAFVGGHTALPEPQVDQPGQSFTDLRPGRQVEQNHEASPSSAGPRSSTPRPTEPSTTATRSPVSTPTRSTKSRPGLGTVLRRRPGGGPVRRTTARLSNPRRSGLHHPPGRRSV
ncbi:MAG: hypothetical protein Ct9H300mP31_00220 [Acidimicrobiaceae bacterium]|nr:MAG: hypothetical protein Ct9H300mP31_00220 [Acidimicrobiaceae bacterium]